MCKFRTEWGGKRRVDTQQSFAGGKLNLGGENSIKGTRKKEDCGRGNSAQEIKRKKEHPT